MQRREFHFAVLTPAELSQTVSWIASVQRRDGSIPWFEGGNTDPWDHVESAMALAVGGLRAEAERAYGWLVGVQRPDGSFADAMRDGEVVDPISDANHVAYMACGVWHHYLLTGDRGFLESMWPAVQNAVHFVLGLQQPEGHILWKRDPDGTPGDHALLTGSSCTYLSLRCALAIAHELGLERPDWELSVGSLRHALVRLPHLFAKKDRFSMDWYYPVLGGVLSGAAARARLNDPRWRARFLVEGRGARCVSDEPWVTAAETCELVMSLELAGLHDDAHQVLEWVQYLRHDDGSYWTGHNYVEDAHFPEGERTTWTAGANVLASALLGGDGPVSEVLGGLSLPRGVEPSSAGASRAEIHDEPVEPVRD